MQKDVWRHCERKKLGGFLVRDDRSLVGLFEGPEKIVISQVENLIRKNNVQSVHVLHEAFVETRSWTEWYTQFEQLADIPQADALNLAGLAQNVIDAVEADQSNT
jgi:hypothetical protein